MPRVVATHAVGNMETWLAGAEERAEIFRQFAIAWENADLDKLQAALADPDTETAKSRHSVLDPVELYLEVEGRR